MTAPAVPATIAPARARRWPRVLRRTLALLVALALAGAWFGRVPLLTGIAQMWIVSDPPATADAVAILGGGIDTRPFAAAEYYRRGLVTRILLSNVGSSPAEQIGVLSAQADVERRILLRLGVPDAAIETFGKDLTNTYQEAVALSDWAARTGARTVIVPTENFSARRVRWVMRRVFPDGVTVLVPAIDRRDYRPDDWWKTEKGVVGFQNELIKHVYYRLKY